MKNVNTACSYEDEMVIYSSMSEKTQRARNIFMKTFRTRKNTKRKATK
jgi:hypothetical protein